MKIKLSLIASVILGAILWQSCSNDFELNAPWQDIPIIYGIIDINEDNHYIRVQKAFLDSETSAVQIAQVSDSIYYNNVSVTIQVNGNQTYNLTRVNGADEGIDKEEGIFATNPHVLYKIAQSEIGLQEGDKVLLTVNRGDELPPVTGETTIVGSAIVKIPNTLNGNKVGFDFKYNSPTSVRWRPGESAEVYDLKLLFTYEEYLFATPGDRDSFTIAMTIDKSIENDGSLNLGPQGNTGIQGIEFYRFVAENVPVKADYQRRFKRIDIQVTGGSNEILETFRILDANTGITSAQDIPVYTNLSEGRGIFASRNQILDSRGLTITTRDSLANGQFTKDLNFLQ